MHVQPLGAPLGPMSFRHMGCSTVGRFARNYGGKFPIWRYGNGETVSSAACLRALTNNEVQDYRREGFTGNVAVVPNGVSIPEETSPELLFEAYPELRSRRIILFLGRLHAKKGADLLCSAWSRIARVFQIRCC